MRPKNLEETIYDVAIIGGGASGMMAGVVAARKGKKVLLLEKNESLGEKLKISGGGRCNITNATYDNRELLKHYGKAEQFLYSPFSQFSVKDTFSFFESLGLKIVVEARNRAFPSTQKAFDVYNSMYRELKKRGAVIETHSPVTHIEQDGGEIKFVNCGPKRYRAKNYILATGGMSHPETGSTGDGFKWLTDLGHTIVKPTPTIVPIRTAERWSHMLSGTSLTFMKISFYLDGKKKFSKTGKILFTHFGLSGPLILNSASNVADLLQAGLVTAKIDCYPDTDIVDLETKVLKVFDEHKNKMFKNILDLIVPPGLAESIPHMLKSVKFDTKVHSVSKTDRRAFIELLKALPLSITGLEGYDRAVVADGGVTLSEIDTKTMRSKVLKNMLVTGDLLHIRRPSGGYSLQLCWTTGFVAGNNV